LGWRVIDFDLQESSVKHRDIDLQCP
jgi:hypothetical protein